MKYLFFLIFLSLIQPLSFPASGADLRHPEPICVPLQSDSILTPHCMLTINSDKDTLCSFSVKLSNDVKGRLAINDGGFPDKRLEAFVKDSDTLYPLSAAIEKNSRSCVFISRLPIRKNDSLRLIIPEDFLEVQPEYVEVDEIDIEEVKLDSLSVAGAWHKRGTAWTGTPMFSVIDDDSIDGQIESSKHDRYAYGYYSLLFPLLESLGIKGNLAIEGRKIGIHEWTPFFNDNGKTLVRLQNEKGWDLLSHSMDCLGENLNNWIVDSLNTPLAREIFNKGPNLGLNAFTVSVFDLKTQKQYWPNTENTEWELTPERFVKPYAGDYSTKKEMLYNPDFSIDWHWGEWKRRAETFGINAVGFVTHNSTSSHALVPGIMEVFPYGLSDIAATNINTVPMLSTAVRAGLEGQSLGNYDGNSKDNTYNKKQYKQYCELIDEAAKKGGWIIFNLHTYRDCWLNSLPGKLISEGGSYPDQWVIPMKGMDSANDPLDPPQHLEIENWSEWYPCQGTRLEMMRDILRYAMNKGLRNVTISEGFRLMGNKKSKGYFNQGFRFGMDIKPGLIDTNEIYPHYVVSATDEVFYYNPLRSKAISMGIGEFKSTEIVASEKTGKFLIGKGSIYWSDPDPRNITLKLFALSGKEIMSVSDNSIGLDSVAPGSYVICAVESGKVVGSIKIAR